MTYLLSILKKMGTQRNKNEKVNFNYNVSFGYADMCQINIDRMNIDLKKLKFSRLAKDEMRICFAAKWLRGDLINVLSTCTLNEESQKIQEQNIVNLNKVLEKCK